MARLARAILLFVLDQDENPWVRQFRRERNWTAAGRPPQRRVPGMGRALL